MKSIGGASSLRSSTRGGTWSGAEPPRARSRSPLVARSRVNRSGIRQLGGVRGQGQNPPPRVRAPPPVARSRVKRSGNRQLGGGRGQGQHPPAPVRAPPLVARSRVNRSLAARWLFSRVAGGGVFPPATGAVSPPPR